ncbi:hypothetical protein MTR67_017999 [Solanum verrucosum]|uniref:Uncharacterized protein n=1 Tax=Solanum verrucosum TaxID=315347 RepID=A0AAF0QIY6_SOLVR|nr:hypothetical protein MTR67_017999 [Solanum verrucosum]
MSVLYHPGKANLVADALYHLSIGSVAHIEDDKKDLVRDTDREAERTIETLEDMLRTYVVDFKGGVGLLFVGLKWDDAARSNPPPPNLTPMVDPTTLVAKANVEMDFPKIIDQAIEKALSLFIYRVVKCEGFIEIDNVMLDNLTTRLEVKEKEEGSSGALDTMKDELATLQTEMV